MKETTLHELFDNFNRLTALVIGDVMVDSYLWGRVDRISPEAPVPVVQITHKEDRLGGAANVALNIAALGAKPIICAVAGKDLNGQILTEILEKGNMHSGGILHLSDRHTTVKTRVISSNQHIVRIDEESLNALNSNQETQFIELITGLVETEKPDVIIFEDYNKGVLTERVIREVIALAK